jgi:four helix bundle protein
MNDRRTGKIKSFTDLLAWREAHKLLLIVYAETKEFPKDELFCLTSQMRRASLSLTSNIAEGFGRQSYKEKIQFYYLAQGSLTELKNQILASKDIGYLNKVGFDRLVCQANKTHQLLQGLIRSSKNILKS